MKPGDKLVVVADKVATRAAGDWDEFLAALRAYKDEQMELLAKAPPGMVYTLQGRAQFAIDILDKLQNCHEKAKNIMELMNGNR